MDEEDIVVATARAAPPVATGGVDPHYMARVFTMAIAGYVLLANFILTILILIHVLSAAQQQQRQWDLIAQRIGTLNQTAWGLAAHTEVTDGELGDLARALSAVGGMMQTLDAENAILFNSTERTRQGLLLLLQYLLAQVKQAEGG